MKALFKTSFILLIAVQAQAEGDALKRKKVLNFEDRRVEAVNKRPLDSFSQISEADKNRKGSHLYDKPSDFSKETAETLEQMRYN